MHPLSRLLPLLLPLLFGACVDQKKIDEAENRPVEEKSAGTKWNAAEMKTDEAGLSLARVKIKTLHGDIIFGLYPKDAPATVTRIAELVQNGFYDGISFHRVVPGFVIQGGDPTGTGNSGSGKNLKAEFNSRKHVLGTVAMARANDPDSADSQFYFSLGEPSHLDGKYTIFGQVTEGLDVLTKISQGDKMISVSISEENRPE